MYSLFTTISVQFQSVLLFVTRQHIKVQWVTTQNYCIKMSFTKSQFTD
jgi:hypothetical protein